jgi:hypothetical protein
LSCRLPGASVFYTPATSVRQRLLYASDFCTPATSVRQRLLGTSQEAEVQFLTKTINKKRAQCKKPLREKYCKYYFHYRPTWDIERQLAGEAPEELEEDIQPPIQLCIPERAQLAGLLCHQSDNPNATNLETLRIKAAELMTMLCKRRTTSDRKPIED